eukprot:TRINITY_DN33050_c0_g1_i1.p1 TRINITY_DN33050_c0_g1~~TRINITY_DN33050_c0_g1_i1.p1  ORF type:complete len:408 (-),score=43.32 TRINITY_DN33050_c0_g1_i1:45-1268(-)
MQHDGLDESARAERLREWLAHARCRLAKTDFDTFLSALRGLRDGKAAGVLAEEVFCDDVLRGIFGLLHRADFSQEDNKCLYGLERWLAGFGDCVPPHCQWRWREICRLGSPINHYDAIYRKDDDVEKKRNELGEVVHEQAGAPRLKSPCLEPKAWPSRGIADAPGGGGGTTPSSSPSTTSAFPNVDASKLPLYGRAGWVALWPLGTQPLAHVRRVLPQYDQETHHDHSVSGDDTSWLSLPSRRRITGSSPKSSQRLQQAQHLIDRHDLRRKGGASATQVHVPRVCPFRRWNLAKKPLRMPRTPAARRRRLDLASRLAHRCSILARSRPKVVCCDPPWLSCDWEDHSVSGEDEDEKQPGLRVNVPADSRIARDLLRRQLSRRSRDVRVRVQRCRRGEDAEELGDNDSG